MKDSTLNLIGKTGSAVVIGGTILLALYALATSTTDMGTALVCILAVIGIAATGCRLWK